MSTIASERMPASYASLQRRARRRLVERPPDLAVRAHALVDLDDARVQRLGQHDLPREDARPVLVGDAERVAEPARDRQRRRLALALEQRVGGDGRPHLHRRDRRAGVERLSRAAAEQAPDAFDRGVAILRRALRQQLVRHEPAVRAPRDDVGERAAAVDPELPAALPSMRFCARGQRVSVSVAGVERDPIVALRAARRRLSALRQRAAVAEHDAQGSPRRKVRRQRPGPGRRAAARRRRRRREDLLAAPVGADVGDGVDPDVAQRLRVAHGRDHVGDRDRRVPVGAGRRERVEEKDHPLAVGARAIGRAVEAAPRSRRWPPGAPAG